jgi:hypothetical protein
MVLITGRIVGWIVGYAVFRAIGLAASINFLILLGCMWLGAFLASRWLDRPASGDRMLRFVMWSNLVTWFFPFLGVLTGSFTYAARERVPGRKARILGVGAMVLSLINSAAYHITKATAQ